MDRESIIKQINALRALSQDKSATVAEAAAAARAAETLIQRHALAEAELGITSATEGIIDDNNPITDWDQRQTVWQNVLLSALAKAYECEVVFKWQDGRVNMFGLGRPSDIAIMRYQYAFFTIEIARLSHLLAPGDLTRGQGKHWHNSFYRGAVSSIAEALKSVKQEVRSQASSTALVFIDQHARSLAAFKSKAYPHSRTKQMGVRVNREAYSMGQMAGSNLNPKPGLPPGVRGLLK